MQKKTSEDIIILGVDPGTNVLGYGIIACNNNHVNILLHGIVHLHKINNHFNKLRVIYDQLTKLINTYNIHVLAIEAPFFGKNVQSMLKLGRAQGAAMLAAVNCDLEIIEYSPRKIKQSVTGKGNASKQQVAKMLCSMYNISVTSEKLDETDAIAVAICHYNSTKRSIPSSKSADNSWEAYIKANPARISKI